MTHHSSFDWVEENGVGVCIKEIQDIPDAVKRIREDYQTYVENVQRFYNETVEFNRYFEPVFEELHSS